MMLAGWNPVSQAVRGVTPVLLRFAAKPAPAGPERILSIAGLKRQITASGSPYVKGVWEEKLPGMSQNNRSQVLRTLDSLAEKLSQIDYPAAQVLSPSFKSSRLPEFRLKIGNDVASFTHVGSGTFGSVFKMSLKGQDFAFKTFYSRHRELYYSGPYSETAMGLYATQKQVSDMPHLIVANPQKNWLLSEFVDAGFQSSTPNGPRWKDLGLKALDADVQENDVQTRIGLSVHLDYGAMTGSVRDEETLHQSPNEMFGFPPGPPPMLSLECFKQLFKHATPEKRIGMMEHVGILSPADRVEALKNGLVYPEFQNFPLAMFVGARVITAAQISELQPWLAKQKSASFKNLAAFVSTQKQDCPEALPLKIASGQTGAFKQWLGDLPGVVG